MAKRCKHEGIIGIGQIVGIVYVFFSVLALLFGMLSSGFRYSVCKDPTHISELFPATKLGCWLAEPIKKVE